MLKVHLNKQYLKTQDIETAANYGGQDIFLLAPFLSEDLYYKILIPKLGNHNDSLYTKTYFSGQQYLKQVDLQNCDYSVIPFKFNHTDNRVLQICQEAHKNNKLVVTFYTDDNTEKISLPDNLILYRTSTNKSTIQKNERVMPPLHPDHFFGFADFEDSIGFCGQLTQLRYEIIQVLQQINVKKDFIFRQGFWAPEINSKIKARKQYYSNLLNNKYALCIRGSGNFSFRFYEALCFGRIPILIDTDTILPFKNIIDWNKHIIFIKQNELSKLPDLIKQDTRSMQENRKLWEKYFSIEGYIQNFHKDI